MLSKNLHFSNKLHKNRKENNKTFLESIANFRD